MGLLKRNDSRYWWMSYTWKGGQHFESTKTTSKALAKKICICLPSNRLIDGQGCDIRVLTQFLLYVAA